MRSGAVLTHRTTSPEELAGLPALERSTGLC